MKKEEFLAKIELNETIVTYPLKKEEIIKKLDKKMIIKKRDILFKFLLKFEIIFFHRIEEKSKDDIMVRIEPLGFSGRYWENLNIKVLQVGEVLNPAGTIEIFYMSEEGLFYNQDQRLISDNEDNFLNYLLTVEYDYHPIIEDITYSRLRDAGWYEGRRIDISNLVEECAADGVILSQKQIEFIQEFGGICGVGVNNREFVISDKIKWYYYKKLKEFDPKDRYTFSPVTIKYGTDTVCVGCCGDGMMPLWITEDGLMVKDDGIQLGRTVMEGFNCLLGRV